MENQATILMNNILKGEPKLTDKQKMSIVNKVVKKSR